MRSSFAVAALFCAFVGGEAAAQVGPSGEIDGLTANFVDVNGVRTRYYDYGRGEPLLLVHGGEPENVLTSSANTWSRNIRPLAERFRVLAVDRLAQGMTENPTTDSNFGMQGEVEHIYAFIRLMKLDTVHLVGHSSGGAAVLSIAVEHPDVVKTLTLVASAGGLAVMTPHGARLNAVVSKCPPADARNEESLRCRALALAYAPSRDAFSPDFVKSLQWMASLPKAAEARRRLAGIRPQLESERRMSFEQMRERARRGAVRVPILIYGGKQDPLHWDLEDVHALRGEMEGFDILGANSPRVKFIIINNCGHLPHREHAEQFNADLVQFIEYWNTNATRAQRPLH